MNYCISTLCFDHFVYIKNHWINRVSKKCKNVKIYIIDNKYINNYNIDFNEYAWYDYIRLDTNINIINLNNINVVYIDMDIIIEKDIKDIINLPYDFIISKEIGENKSFPQECSSILGFGICSGFYVIKKESIDFLKKILNNMKNKTYNSYSDQVNIMNYIINNKYNISKETCILDGIKYTNNIIEIDNIKICVLDFDIITRDPIINKNQYGNHINIKNVGGINSFIRYFYEPLESLPLTCRCNKHHLGDYNECIHINMRNKNNLINK